ncbi:MAG: TonB-dependent siderophore receptor [Xanthobacteraceae bacterium]|nr:TonB-dependent siderophore receptor [Xanthobacteraceae bacterium]
MITSLAAQEPERSKAARDARAQAETALPRIVVRSPKPRPARRAVAAPRRPATPQVPVAQPARDTGAVVGYVAHQSVSATKTNAALIETPQAVSVVGAEQIRDQRPSKFDEVFRYSPGVKGEVFGPDLRNDWFLIRGFKSDNDGIFLDSMQLFYTSFGSFKIQPFGLERAEVVRGPSSPLFGSGSPGGVLNAISKRPTVDPLRYLEAGVNNYGNRYVNFDFGGPATAKSQNGQFLYRLTGQAKAGNTDRDHVQDDNYFFAPSFTWATVDTKLTVLAMGSHNDTKGLNFLPYQGTVTPAPFGRIPTSFFAGEPGSDKWSRNQLMVGYQFEHAFNKDLTFRQNARYAHVNIGFSSYYGQGYFGDPANAQLARNAFYTRASAAQTTLDSQLEYKFNTGAVRHTALVGVDVKNYTLDDYQAFGFFAGTPLKIFNPNYSGQRVFAGAPYQDSFRGLRQVGVYLQDQIKFDRFTLLLTGRRDTIWQSNDNRLAVGPPEREDSKFTGRAGLIYTFDNGLAPYISYATSFAPVIGANATTGAIFSPETAKQGEVGLKYSPTWMNGYFGVAVFDLTRQNISVSDFSVVPAVTTQIGEINSKGFELEAVVNPIPGLKITGAYTQYDFVTTKDIVAASVGKILVATPERFGSAWVDYTFQSGPLRGFGAGAGLRYTGRSFADPLNQFVVPSSLVGDATIHYENGGWRYAINAVNIADKVYVASCSSLSACYYGERLRVTGSVAYKW